MRFALLLVVGVTCSGCSRSPVLPTVDSTVKKAFEIHEWSFEPKLDEGLSVVVFDGQLQSEGPHVAAGAAVQAIYLQESSETGDYVLKIDAGERGIYGSAVPNPFADKLPRIHKEALKHNELWILMSDQDGLTNSDGKPTPYIALSFPNKSSIFLPEPIEIE